MRPEELYPEIVEPRSADVRTRRERDEVGLRYALIDVLILWERGCAPRRPDAPPIDRDLIAVYARSLARIDVTSKELEDARDGMLLESTFFPAVAEIASWIKERRVRNAFAGHIECLNDEGIMLLAPPRNVRNGRLVESGGNGVPCLPHADKADVLARIEGHRQELGVERLIDATPEQMASIGLRPSLAMPSVRALERRPMSAEESERLIEEARQGAEVKRTGATSPQESHE